MSNYKNNWQSTVSRSKKSPSNGKQKDTVVYPKRLKEFFETNYCIYHFMDKCTGGDKCESTHMEQNQLFKNLQRIILNPIRIPKLNINQNDMNDYLKKNSPIGKYGMEPYITACWYAIQHKKCNNAKNSRYIMYQANFGNKVIPIYICYPDVSTCKTRVTCGFHFDIEYSFTNNVFNVENVISLIDMPNVDTENRQQYVDIVQEETKEETKEFEIKDLNEFPSLSVPINNKVESVWFNNNAKYETHNEIKDAVDVDVDVNVNIDVDTNVDTNVDTDVDTDVNNKVENVWLNKDTNISKIIQIEKDVLHNFPQKISIYSVKDKTVVNIKNKTDREFRDLLVSMATKNKALYYECLKTKQLLSYKMPDPYDKYKLFEKLDVDDYINNELVKENQEDYYEDEDDEDYYEDDEDLLPYFDKPVKYARNFIDYDYDNDLIW
jgi:hypothetical protein